MTRTLLLSIAVLLLLPATSLAAKKKEPKPLVLEPLAAELRALAKCQAVLFLRWPATTRGP